MRVANNSKKIAFRSVLKSQSSAVPDAVTESTVSEVITKYAIAGEVLPAFCPVYFLSGKIYKALTKPAEYITLSSAILNESIAIQNTGTLNVTIASGNVYLNAGAISVSPDTAGIIQKLGVVDNNVMTIQISQGFYKGA